MIKRAKRLALDIFSNLKNAYSSKSRDNKRMYSLLFYFACIIHTFDCYMKLIHVYR